MSYSERLKHLGNIKDLIWFLKGYITAKGEDERNDFCGEHIETLKLALKLINEYFDKQSRLEGTFTSSDYIECPMKEHN